MLELVILDFDGVVVDSETIANGVLAEELTALGRPMTTAEALSTFAGKTLADEVTMFAELTGKHLPESYAEELAEKILAALCSQVRPIEGFADFISGLGATPYCIASSSSPERLAACLDAIGMTAAFPETVFSVSHVTRNKPFPDVFLHAAAQMGVEPANAVVIEDSVHGVRAGCAAGMRVIGFTAGSHLLPGHDARLLEAGAFATAASYREVARLLQNARGRGDEQ